VDLVARTVVVFLFIFVVTRAVGRRELSSLEPFDLILLVVIGDLVQQGVTQSDYSVTGSILVVSTIALLTVAMSYLSYRFRRLRPVLRRIELRDKDLARQLRRCSVSVALNVAEGMYSRGGNRTAGKTCGNHPGRRRTH